MANGSTSLMSKQPPFYARLMPQRRFPPPWRFEPMPGGNRVIDANGLALAHVYGQPPAAIAFSDQRLTDVKPVTLPSVTNVEKAATMPQRAGVLVDPPTGDPQCVSQAPFGCRSSR